MLLRAHNWLLLFFLAIGGVTRADEKMRWGFEIKNFSLPGGASMGDLAGFRNATYLGGSPISVGFEVHVGATKFTNLGNDDHLYIGGVTLGADELLYKGVMYEVNVMAGYADGRFDTLGTKEMGIIVEPSLGLGFILGGGWRISFRGGYFYMPQRPGFSGVNFGLRLDRKVKTTAKGIDE